MVHSPKSCTDLNSRSVEACGWEEPLPEAVESVGGRGAMFLTGRTGCDAAAAGTLSLAAILFWRTAAPVGPCRSMCCFNLSCRAKLLPQSSHSYGFSPVCKRRCRFRCAERKKARWQKSHLKGRYDAAES
jgi:hypothetical protein